MIEITQQQHDELTKIADAVASDISSDMPEHADNTDYDLWIEEMFGTIIGVIDMGDMYQGVYVWTGRGWEHDLTYGDPFYIVDKIIEKRRADSGR